HGAFGGEGNRWGHRNDCCCSGRGKRPAACAARRTPTNPGNARMIYLPELTTLAESLDYHAASRPEHRAVLAPDRSGVSYREVEEQSRRREVGRAKLGVGEGTRVAFIGKEHPSYWEALFACVRLGAVLVPVNWRLTAEEVDHILRDSGAGVVLLDADHPLRGA